MEELKTITKFQFSVETQTHLISHVFAKFPETTKSKSPPTPKDCRTLFSAALSGIAVEVEALLSHGCPQNMRDEKLRTLLHLTAMNGDIEPIFLFLQKESAA